MDLVTSPLLGRPIHWMGLPVALLLGVACSTPAHEAGPRSTREYLAQAVDACRPGEPSPVCCWKKFRSADACGMTASEAAEAATLMQGMREAQKATSSEAADPDEGWRQHCIDTYTLCASQKKPRWTGDCNACMERCRGQHQWPFELCQQGKDGRG